MKPKLCTSNFIYFIEEDELYSNRVNYEIIARSPVDAQDLSRQNVNGYYRVELALGEDLNEFSQDDYKDDGWYIVDEQEPGLLDIPIHEALISF